MLLKNINIKPLTDKISEFLMSKSGMANGYNTFMEGTIGDGSSLKWHTPISDDLTLKEIKKIGYNIQDELTRIAHEIYIPEGITIEVIHEHLEWGCCKTEVLLKQEIKYRVELKRSTKT